MKLFVNGMQGSREIDLFAADVSPLRAVELGEFDLPAGDNTLRIETVASNPKSQKPGYHFGIVGLTLRRLDANK